MAAAPTARPSTAVSSTSQTALTSAAPTEASSKLAEALDDFLSSFEKRFKTVSEEMLTKLDDMAERCDRLEQEMLMRDEGGPLNAQASRDGDIKDEL